MTATDRALMFLGSTLVAGGATVPSIDARYNGISGTTAGTAYADSTWVQVVASTGFDTEWLRIHLEVSTNTSGGASGMFLEVGVGGSGSETQVLAVDVSARSVTTSSGYPMVVNLPIPIPAGSRVTMRMRSSGTSVAWRARVGLGTIGYTPKAPVAMGLDPATAQGVTLSAPGANDGTTFGVWTTISATTAARFLAVHVGVGIAKQPNAAKGEQRIQVGVGAASSEVVICDLWSLTDATEATSPGALLHGVDVPAGSRLSARYARTAGANCSLSLHGIPL